MLRLRIYINNRRVTVVFLVFSAAVDRLMPPLSQAVSIAGLLVMVSSELVVLLIVCVGINTGSAQQGELLKKQLLSTSVCSTQRFLLFTLKHHFYVDCMCEQ